MMPSTQYPVLSTCARVLFPRCPQDGSIQHAGDSLYPGYFPELLRQGVIPKVPRRWQQRNTLGIFSNVTLTRAREQRRCTLCAPRIMIPGTESDRGLPGETRRECCWPRGSPTPSPLSRTEAEAHEGSQSAASSIRNLGVQPLGPKDATSGRAPSNITWAKTSRWRDIVGGRDVDHPLLTVIVKWGGHLVGTGPSFNDDSPY